MKKQVIFLFIIILSSCHVHYHFKDAAVKCPLNVSGPLPFITEGAFYPIGDIRLINRENKGCGVFGCAVLHGGDRTEGIPKIIAGEGLKIYEEPNNSMITVYPIELPSQYSYDKIDTTNIYTLDNIGFHHAAGELSEKEKAIFKTLNDTLK